MNKFAFVSYKIQSKSKQTRTLIYEQNTYLKKTPKHIYIQTGTYASIAIHEELLKRTRGILSISVILQKMLTI